MTNIILETIGLTKNFGRRRAVDDLSLQVFEGDIYGFLGPNGAGKSTTIRMLTGLVRPKHGTASLLGRDIRAQHTQALKEVGALVELPAFYKYMTASQNLKLLSRMSGSCDEKRIDQVLDTVGLFDRRNDKVKSFSHGMQQRLGIGQALLPDPKLIILDEPTSGLDPQGMRDVRELILRLAKDEKKTIFLSSHLLHEVEQVCTRVGIINHGKLIAEGDVKNLLQREVHAVEFKVSDGEKAAGAARKVDSIEVLDYAQDHMLVRTPNETVPEINRTLVGAGVDVFAITPKAETLEDFFLELTREGESADQA